MRPIFFEVEGKGSRWVLIVNGRADLVFDTERSALHDAVLKAQAVTALGEHATVWLRRLPHGGLLPVAFEPPEM